MTIREAIKNADLQRPNQITESEKVAWINELEGLVQTKILRLSADALTSYLAEVSYAGNMSFPDAQTLLLASAGGFRIGDTVKVSVLSAYEGNNDISAKVLSVSADGLTLTFAENTFPGTGTTPESGAAYADRRDAELIVPTPYDRIYDAYLMMRINLYAGDVTSYNNDRAWYNTVWDDFAKWFSRNHVPGKTEALGFFLTAYGLAVKNGFTGTEEEWLLSLKGERGWGVSMRYSDGVLQWRSLGDSTWTDLLTLAELQGSLVSDTLAEAQTAKTGAETAQTAAENAQTAAETAESGAKTAEAGAGASAVAANTKALAAASSASAASESAAAAAASAASITGAVDASAASAASASASASAALISKNAAAGSADSASGSASSAAGSASAAEEKADSASQSADAAAASESAADTAKTAAQTAKTAAEAAKAAAESARDTAAESKTAAESASATASTKADAASVSAASAANSAAAAAVSEENAGTRAGDAEAWAVGQRGGVNVESTDPAYQNNAKYYKDQAGEIAGGDYPTKSEAQGYVDTHNQALDAHGALFAGKQDAIDILTAMTDLADADYLPLYDTSAAAEKKTLWSTIKSTLKSYFDGLYTAASALTSHTADTDNPHSVTYSQVGADASGAAATVQTNLNTHTANKANPHSVTASQVGLGSVPNVTTNSQTPTYTVASTLAALASGEVLSTAFGKIAKAVSSLISHLSNTSNPHSVTYSQAGADASGAAASAVATHNSAATAHSALFAALRPGWKLIQTYAAAGTHTWTAPDIYGDGSAYSVGVFIIAGGGSGGISSINDSTSSSTRWCFSQGGASGHTKIAKLTVVPGETYNIVVGSGGAIKSGSGTCAYSGNPGGSSAFNGITASGGDGGCAVENSTQTTAYASGGQAPDSTSDYTFYMADSGAPSRGEIRKEGGTNYSRITVPTESINPFDGLLYLAAGGCALISIPGTDTDCTVHQQARGYDDSGNYGGAGDADGALKSSASAAAEDASGYGCGGGGATAGARGTGGSVSSVVSGKGGNGAVLIYAERVTA